MEKYKKDNLSIVNIKSRSEVESFWKSFDNYIEELSQTASKGDDFDLEYFYSSEYRDAIESLRVRDMNPLQLMFIQKAGVDIGFVMYVTYFDQGGKCFLMEYYIVPEHRNQNYGRNAYAIAEDYIIEDGARYIELTPTNEMNERFWRSVGFKKTDDLDEDNKNYYRKRIRI